MPLKTSDSTARRIAEYRTTLDREKTRYQLAVESVKKEAAARQDAQQQIVAITEAQQLIQAIAADIQQQAHTKIATIATRCLQAVFEEDYEIRIYFDQKRGKTEARIVLSKDGREMDPLTAAGGGIVDVAAFALRLACLSLSRPKLRQLVVADEPFRCVSRNHSQRLRQLLEVLATDLGMQFVLVTHDPKLAAGKVIEF